MSTTIQCTPILAHARVVCATHIGRDVVGTLRDLGVPTIVGAVLGAIIGAVTATRGRSGERAYAEAQRKEQEITGSARSLDEALVSARQAAVPLVRRGDPAEAVKTALEIFEPSFRRHSPWVGPEAARRSEALWTFLTVATVPVTGLDAVDLELVKALERGIADVRAVMLAVAQKHAIPAASFPDGRVVRDLLTSGSQDRPFAAMSSWLDDHPGSQEVQRLLET